MMMSWFKRNSRLHHEPFCGRSVLCRDVAVSLFCMTVATLLASGFFEGVDVILPVPLHKKKQQIRGYNQSEWIARGIAAVTGISIDTESVVRQKNTETQTRKSSFERWENVEGIFQLHHAEPLAGKHVLIVDDVLTTGATTVECASCLAEIEGIRISILTLAMAE